MKILDIAFTGYPVTDMKRSRAFYEDVLGLTKSRGFGQHEGEDQWVEYDIGSGCLALIAGGGKDVAPGSTGVAATLEVDDFDGCLAKLRESGAKLVFEPFDGPTCRLAVVTDPDGNRLGIHCRKTG
jgi:predicted enzyme related to lactoylglutathione lyase